MDDNTQQQKIMMVKGMLQEQMTDVYRSINIHDELLERERKDQEVNKKWDTRIFVGHPREIFH